MGIGLPKKDRVVFEQLLAEESVSQRVQHGDRCGPTTPGQIGAAPATISRVVIDAPPFVRRYAPTRETVDAYALANRMVNYAVDLLSPEFMDGTGSSVAEIFIMFDTQANMPEARGMVAQRRSPLATQAELDRIRANPGCGKVEVNGRIYKYDERPLSEAEIAAFSADEHAPFSFMRAMSSRKGKEAVWALVEKTLVQIFAEITSAGRALRVTIDGPRTGPDAITFIDRGPAAGKDCYVCVTHGPRAVHWGEADLKVAHVSARVPLPHAAAAQVLVTNDRDQLCQQLVLAQSRQLSCRNTFILFLPHVMDRGPPQWVDTFGFPTCGRGSTLALLLTLGGSDYTVSLLGAGLKPTQAVESGGISPLQKCFSVSDEFPNGVIHSGGVVDALCRSFTGRKPTAVFCFDEDTGSFYISKAAAVAACPGQTPRKRPRTLGDLHTQLRESLWLLSYWALTGSESTPAGPPPLPESVGVFQVHSPLYRFLQNGSRFEPAVSIPL